MLIYVAGPMRGIELFNFPAFDEAERLGKSLGHDIISPATLDREAGFKPEMADPDNFDTAGDAKVEATTTIIRDVVAICQCDAIALLPGWKESLGVKVEFALATFLGLQILDATTFKPFPQEWKQTYVAYLTAIPLDQLLGMVGSAVHKQEK